MAASSSSSSSRNSDNHPIETIIHPNKGLIELPSSFNEVWARAKIRYNQTKISMSDKICNVAIRISDKTVLFYAYEVAACFGFREPTKVLLKYIADVNTFSMEVVQDAATKQLPTDQELICIISSDDESDSEDKVKGEEKTTEQNEVVRIVTWCKRVTTAMANPGSKQSLHFPTFVSTRFLQNIDKLKLQCPETGFSYTCEIHSSKEKDNNGFYMKRIGSGWTKFKKEHKPEKGDLLMFELSYYPYLLNVKIDRKAAIN